ncbi:SAM-dependent methyltransferase [Porphyromonas levii]|uniref:SAM-dependent methyltransferase n=1 Tax=Porphyromonas levii TaxID=28114 RepID=UPI001B8BC63B|nr:SAM-dependent methyltransferase [Porphyromonas levii]MBR8764533.1 Ribosomal RNA small subunit methyltransferase I [Porphyromonas levii]MBR8770553.1 Ribosomal RNA small subunit methyltransferase I [Porphyromonas levii]
MTFKNLDGVGNLYLIPISIGEVGVGRYLPADNLDIIRHTKHYVVENARTARQYIKSVLPEINISTLSIIEVDKHQGYSYPKDEVLQLLRSGMDVGLMSEAGCPAVADPGHHVVADCHRAGIKVVPLVGPSSILLSLMASGFSGQNFAFHGYLTFDNKERRRILLEWQRRAQQGETQIFIEAPYRNDKLIEELVELLSPSQKLSVAIDLTTPTEEVHTMVLSEWRKLMKSGASWHKRPAIFLLGK